MFVITNKCPQIYKKNHQYIKISQTQEKVWALKNFRQIQKKNVNLETFIIHEGKVHKLDKSSSNLRKAHRFLKKLHRIKKSSSISKKSSKYLTKKFMEFGKSSFNLKNHKIRKIVHRI